jgi:RNA polymerase sigma factor (sigma-70 family)
MGVATNVEATDEQLLTEFIGSGSAAAFGGIVERHLAMVRSVAARALGDGHEAEDVAQAVFILLARKAPTLRNPGALSGWLFRTAEFTARRARRKLATRAGYERKAAVVLQEERESSPQVPSDWPELRGRLDRAITALPEPSQRAVVLCYLEGRSREDVAGMLGCSVDALAMRLSRALRRLRGKLSSRGVSLSVAGISAGLTFEAAWGCANAGAASAASVAAGALAVARGQALAGAGAAAELIAADVSRALLTAKLAKGAIAAAAAGLLGVVLLSALGRGAEDRASSPGYVYASPRMIYRDPGEYSEWVSQWKLHPAGTIPPAPGAEAPLSFTSKRRRPITLDVHPSPDGNRVVLVVSGKELLSFRYVPGTGAAAGGKAETPEPRKLQSGIVRAGRFPVNWLPGGRFLLCGGGSAGRMLLELYDSRGRRLRSIPVPEIPTEIPLVGGPKLRSIAPVLVGPRGRRVAVLRADYVGKGRLVRDAAVIVPLEAGAGRQRLYELLGEANVVEAAWDSQEERLLIARTGFGAGRVTISVQELSARNGKIQDVFSASVTPPEELRDLRWPRGAPRVSFSPDAARLLIVWRESGIGPRVLRAEVADLNRRKLIGLDWVDGPGTDPRERGEWFVPVARPRWSRDAATLTYAVSRPKPGASAKLCRYSVADGRTRELTSWPAAQGPRGGDVYPLAEGAVAFVAHRHLWVQRTGAADLPVPLAVLPDGASAKPIITADGRRIYWPSWELSDGGQLRRRGVMAFAAKPPKLDAELAGAYWRAFRSGRDHASVERELRDLISGNPGEPLAELAGRYLKECRPAEPKPRAQSERPNGPETQPEIF